MPDPVRVGDRKPDQLFCWYAGLIRSGSLPPGASLSVRRIIAEHGVSGHTAARALHLLARRGLVEVRAGRGGTVVRGPS